MIWNRRKKEKNTKKDTTRMRRAWMDRGFSVRTSHS